MRRDAEKLQRRRRPASDGADGRRATARWRVFDRSDARFRRNRDDAMEQQVVFKSVSGVFGVGADEDRVVMECGPRSPPSHYKKTRIETKFSSRFA
ncbi:hypothetical protein Scep_026652 [Stephania cephalantha]|uniref:Uncharacterized protein n=1 Tax=Stephania cephalantha TaxID=152367 RepID=A0AAP0EST6_9MAGN